MKRYQLTALRNEIQESSGQTARALLVAYGLLRGLSYRQIEPRTRDTIAIAKHGAGPSIVRACLHLGAVEAIVKHGGMTKQEAEAICHEVKSPPADLPVVAPTSEVLAARKARATFLREQWQQGIAQKAVG
jgi:hypothetical protein